VKSLKASFTIWDTKNTFKVSFNTNGSKLPMQLEEEEAHEGLRKDILTCISRSAITFNNSTNNMHHNIKSVLVASGGFKVHVAFLCLHLHEEPQRHGSSAP